MGLAICQSGLQLTTQAGLKQSSHLASNSISFKGLFCYRMAQEAVLVVFDPCVWNAVLLPSGNLASFGFLCWHWLSWWAFRNPTQCEYKEQWTSQTSFFLFYSPSTLWPMGRMCPTIAMNVIQHICRWQYILVSRLELDTLLDKSPLLQEFASGPVSMSKPPTQERMEQEQFYSGQMMHCLKGCLDREGSPGWGSQGHTLSQGFPAEEGAHISRSSHIWFMTELGHLSLQCCVGWAALPMRQETIVGTTGIQRQCYRKTLAWAMEASEAFKDPGQSLP